MPIRIGRALLSTPLRANVSTPRDFALVRSLAGFTMPGDETLPPDVWPVEGREAGERAQTDVDLLKAEGKRVGDIWVEDLDDVVPAGYYALRRPGYEKPGGAPKVRPWDCELVEQPEPRVRFEAEDHDARNLGATVDLDASERKKVVYTATATQTPVLKIGSSLVHHFRMEEAGTPLTDQSGFGGDGTVNGAPGQVAGKLGNARDFDAVDDYVSVADAPFLRPARFTVEVWVKPDTVSAGTRRIRHKGADVTLYQSGTSVKANFNGSGLGADLDTGAVLAATTWAHLVLTYDKANLRLYVGGVEKASGAATASPTYSAAAVTLGATATPDEFFDGVIDEPRLYNRALSKEEVKERFDITTGGTRPAKDYRAPLDAALDLPRGKFKVVARVRSATTFTQKFVVAIRDKDGTNIAASADKTNTAAGTWEVLEFLAAADLDSAANEAQQFALLFVQANVDLNDVWLDYVEFVKVP